MAVKSVIFKLQADTKSLDKGLDSAKKKLDDLNKTFLSVTKNVDALAASVNSLTGAFANANASAAAFAKNIKQASSRNKEFRGLQVDVENAHKSYWQFGQTVNDSAKGFKNVSFEAKAAASSATAAGKAGARAANESTGAWDAFRKTVRDARVILSALFVSRRVLDFASSSLIAAANFEKLNIAFTTFIKYAGDARLLLKDLQNYAIKTPFTTEEVQQSGRVLLAYGFKTEQIIPTLNMLGDVASGTGADLKQMAVVFGQVKAAGKLMGQDLLQLINAGFNPLQEISKRTKVSMATLRKEMEDGKLTFDRIQESFFYATSVGGKFYELNEKYSQSLAGRWSTLQDNLQLLNRDMGMKLMPTAKKLVEVFIGWTTALRNGDSFIQRHGKLIIQAAQLFLFYRIAMNKTTQEMILNTVSNKQNEASVVKSNLARAIAIARFRIEAAIARENTIAMKAYAASVQFAKFAWQSFTAILKTNAFGIIVTFLPEIISLFQKLAGASDEATQAQLRLKAAQESLPKAEDDVAKAGNDAVIALNNQIDAIEKTTEGTIGRQQALKKFIDTYDEYLKKDSQATKQLKDGTALKMKDKDLMVLMKKVYSEIAESVNIKAYNEKVDLKIAQEQASLESDRIKLNQIKIEQQLKINALYKKYKEELALPDGSGNLATDRKAQAKFWIKAAEDQRDAEIKTQEESIKTRENNILELKKKYKEVDNDIVANFEDGAGREGFAVDKLKAKWEDLLKTVRSNRREITAALVTVPGKDEISQLLNAQIDYYNKKNALAEENRAKEIELEHDKTNREQDYLQELQNIQDNPRWSEATKNKRRLDAKKRYEQDVYWINADLQKNDEELATGNNLLWENYLNIQKGILREFAAERKKALEDIAIGDLKQNVNELERVGKLLGDKEAKITDNLDKAKTGRQFRRAKKQLKQTWQDQVDNLYVTTKAKEAELRAEQKQNDRILKDAGKGDEVRLAAWLDYNNQISNLKRDAKDAEIKMMEGQQKTLEEKNKAHRDAILDGWSQLIGDVSNIATQTLDSYMSVVDAQLNATQRAYDKAKDIADKGNATLLEAEQTRMDKLNEKRRRFANAQKAIIQTQIIAEAALAVAKAAGQTGAGAPFAIASTIIALVAGIASAKAAADAAMADGGFAKGGYTGDGGKYEAAGTVHKGEFVFNKETTQKHRTLFEQIHKGRDPYFAMQAQGNMVAINNAGVESRLERIEKAIMGQQGMRISIDENGIHGIVSRIDYKQNRIRNQAR